MNMIVARTRHFVRFATRWAWEPEWSAGRDAMERCGGAERFAHARGLQLALLEELFREKQAKITRLQQCYARKARPLYEDLRQENPIGTAEALAQSISVLAQRAAAALQQTGQPWRHSDGTVRGVPRDQPNVETGDGWS